MSDDLDGDFNISDCGDLDSIIKRDEMKLEKTQWKIAPSRLFK